MSFTFTIPTWKQIGSWFSLAVVGYASIVSPQYDWLVFVLVYMLGIGVAFRSWFRQKQRVWADPKVWKDYKCGGSFDLFLLFVPYFLCCILWPLLIPIFFIVFVSTFAKKTSI